MTVNSIQHSLDSVKNNNSNAAGRMEHERIDNDVRKLLEMCGLEQEGDKQRLYDVLYYLLTAAALRDTMNADEKNQLKPLMKHLQFYFSTKFNLKERREKKKKESFPPYPLIKKESKKAQGEKTYIYADGVFSKALDKRKEAFRQECLAFIGQYETQRVTDFYLYWAEETTKGGKMRWETEKTWNTEMRMKRWVSNPISMASTAAAIRMKKAKQQQQKEQAQQQTASEVAKEREQADLQREAETERSKKEAGGLAEAVANNPTGILAHVMRERQKREAHEKQKASNS